MSFLRRRSVAICISAVITIFSILYMVQLDPMEDYYYSSVSTAEMEDITNTQSSAYAPSPVEETPASAEQGLLGRWYWWGSPYYVFEADGRGTMTGSDIFWSASGGVLSVCATPDICNTINDCFAPSRWNYELDGSQLTLTSTTTGITFNYTRTP